MNNNEPPLTVQAMADWALAQQQLALSQIQATAGEGSEEFSEHCEEFMRFTDALSLIRRFEHQARG